jgi:hypothetical protein
MSGRRIVRFSLDLEAEQKNFVRLFALKNGINASVVMRALLYILETDPSFANRVIDLIFEVPEEEVETDEFDEDAQAPVTDDSVVETVTVLKISDIKPGDYVYDSNGNRVIVE